MTTFRNQTQKIQDQLVSILPTVAIASVVALGGVIITVILARETNNPIWKLAKDPAEVLRYPPYIGLLSNWGSLLWMSTAALCLFAAALMHKYSAGRISLRFIMFSGVLSLILTFDDLFRLHDYVLPALLNVPEGVFYFFYILTFILYLFTFKRQILSHDYILLMAALFLFIMSRGTYRILPVLRETMSTPDILKHFGIVFWLAYFYRANSQEISALIQWKKSTE